MPPLRPRALLLLVALPAALLTLVVTVLPFVQLAHRAPGIHIAIEAAAGVIALVASYLVFGRYVRSASRNDLVLGCALAIFALVNVCFAALPAAFNVGPGSGFPTWAPACGRLLGTTLFAAAAISPDARVRRPRRDAAVFAVVLLAALIAIGVVAAAAELPQAIDPALSPDASKHPRVSGNAAVLALYAAMFALFAAAAVGFARRATSANDTFFMWFAAGAVLAGFAAVNYFLFPSLYSEWVYTGDVFRLCFYLALLAGALGEIGFYWREVAHAATLEERRRLARELHDGLAQELAFIASQSRNLVERGTASTGVGHIQVAADRALAEARRAIATLTRPLDEPLPKVVGEVAEEVATRSGLDLELSLSADVEVSPRTREELVRIVREAVTNAAQHGHATSVRIELENGNGDGLRLSVADDGVGFDPAVPRRPAENRGFGLTNMHERARSLGGRLVVRSCPGRGTEVEVRVP
ncbi:MAG: sensor histidine kinase [Actinomycetota bacterium]|nr:sensor histidine kinase [Actinomycetota bacterium]